MAVILVKNNKGGVAKSWLSLQLGHRLANLGYPTLIITSDSQNNILDYAGKDKDFKNTQTLEYWLKKADGNFIDLRDNLCYIAFNSSSLASDLEYKFNYFILDMLETREFKYIIIDGSPVLKLDEVFTKTANHIIVPAYMDNVTINSTTDFINSSEVHKVSYIVPNRFNRTATELDIYNSMKDYLEGSSVNVSEPIKSSSYVANLINNGKTIYDSKSKKVEYIKLIIDKIIEYTLEINILEREYEQKNKN